MTLPLTMADLENLTIEQLDQLSSMISDQRRATIKAAQAEARSKIEAIAKAAGMNLADLFGHAAPAKPAKAARGEVPPKYRHPENEAITWSGRGRQPDWYKAHIEAGKSADDLLI